jgi:Family of unknown function (DUF6526)
VQSYARHTHHPTPTYLAGAFVALAMVCFAGAGAFGWATWDAGLISLAMAVVVLVSISRQYTVRLQDRIILLEMKVRCAELLRPEQESLLSQLDTKQIVALRFASDAELGELLERAVREKMSSKDIKRAIKQWRPDYWRT